MLIPIDRPIIDARNIRPAATQTVSVGFIATHNNKAVLLLTCDVADRISGAPHIQAGAKVGQLLTIIVTDDANRITLLDGGGTGTQLNGSWAIADGYGIGAWLKVVWDGTRWREVGRGNGELNAGGICAYAEGSSTVATGNFGHAEGYDTNVTGDTGSHAEGHGTTASGDSGSHAEGHATEASGNSGAHAEGRQTVASGFASHAEGYYSVANLYAEHAQAGGRFAATGDAQFIKVVGRKLITMSNAWQDILLLDGADDLLVIPANTLFAFAGLVAGAESGLAAKKYARNINHGAIWRDGANNTTLLASSMLLIHKDDASYDCKCVADDPNNALQIQITDTDNDGVDVRWVATIWGTMVSFP